MSRLKTGTRRRESKAVSPGLQGKDPDVGQVLETGQEMPGQTGLGFFYRLILNPLQAGSQPGQRG